MPGTACKMAVGMIVVIEEHVDVRRESERLAWYGVAHRLSYSSKGLSKRSTTSCSRIKAAPLRRPHFNGFPQNAWSCTPDRCTFVALAAILVLSADVSHVFYLAGSERV